MAARMPCATATSWKSRPFLCSASCARGPAMRAAEGCGPRRRPVPPSAFP